MKHFLQNRLFILYAIVAGIFLISCNKVKNEPQSTAQVFVEAILKEDFDKASKYATKDSQSALEMLKSAKEAYKRFGKEEEFDIAKELKGKKVEYTQAKMEDDNRAMVTVLANGKETIPLVLIKEDEHWKVAFDKATIMNTERQ